MQIMTGPTDLQEFERIVAAHEAAVRAFLAVRLEDPFEAYDLAQEVFLVLWKRLGEIDLDQPLRPWLLGVAANLVRQHRRKSRAIPIGSSEAVLELLTDRLENFEAFDGAVFTSLEHCLAKLDEQARQVIDWRYVQGLGIREICERIGGKHSAVTMKLHRLRSLLFDCIQSRLRETS